MQLKKSKKGKITALLASATCSLIGGNTNAAEDRGWQIDSAVLLYSEKDRVDVVEPVVSATKTFDDDSILNLKLVADSLTGASPSGATPSDVPQTFTRPSGKGSYVTPAGEVPLDDTFKDSRTEFRVQYEYPLSRQMRISGGLAYSKEYDYTSAVANVGIARDFFEKNTTVSLALAYANDTIDPEGGVPIPFASMAAPGPDQPRQGTEEDKTVTDFVLGLTQVINRQTVMQFNYGYSNADGYLTDPFKIVSVVDGTSGATLDYVFENRPDTRVKQNLYWKTKHALDNGDVIDFSYRYLWDDWEVSSHTLDLRYRWIISDKHYLEPHVRYYVQEEAEFYAHNLVDGQVLPSDVSADPRLGAFDGITYGFKYGYRITPKQEVSLRLEYYEQNGDTVGNPIGIQNNFDLFPDLEAVIVQFGYTLRF
ncbi:MAG: DUF3570 domain-containing protein [Halioglobus sp.]